MLTGDALSQHVAITGLGSPAVRGAITELAQRFEAQTGYRVVANYDVFAVLKRRIDAGEAFDMVILSPELIDELVASGTVAHDTRLDLGRHGVGLGAREGLTLPDIQNVEAFRRSVLAAESIPYSQGGHGRSALSVGHQPTGDRKRAAGHPPSVRRCEHYLGSAQWQRCPTTSRAIQPTRRGSPDQP